MSTIDMNSVAGFKAVDAEGNELGIMSLADITAAVKESIMQDATMARSVATLSEASTLAASDTYEDKLPQQTDLKWARGLDANGNPILISKESLASVVGGLLGNPPKYIEQDSTDCNNITTYCVVSSYKWSNAPSGASIGILEVIPYSPDWIMQRYTNINETPTTYIRSYYNAEAWSPWKVL